ncbi:helix-turn-helix domain-containing protein [Carboxylicivirga sediminis]|uniref:Helix-turn-helix domain-containing protein n=1 Tax=Carboxylicivirga sediminis TaxID=2006564 RepID=A0A941IWE7_9BACT|nr:helix-turn-helix domain-containing protein [Carboxylicivirga sediminis]MBR8535125.1 helix-turn-helix domain-containing protein [Carboxylicivirga sediminis]
MTDLERKELRDIIKEEILPFTKKALTIKEASVFTDLTERTIYKKTSLGEIPHYKQAGKLFFDRLELEDWLLANRGFSKADISRAAATYNMNASLNR